jgi:hypothetical protein
MKPPEFKAWLQTPDGHTWQAACDAAWAAHEMECEIELLARKRLGLSPYGFTARGGALMEYVETKYLGEGIKEARN